MVAEVVGAMLQAQVAQVAQVQNQAVAEVVAVVALQAELVAQAEMEL